MERLNVHKLLNFYRILPAILISPILLAESTNSLTENQMDAMVDTLLEGRKSGSAVPLLSTNFGHFALEEAYKIEHELSKKLEPLVGEVVGYKVAFATADALEEYNLDAPVTGALYNSYQAPDGGTIHIKDFFLFHIETEIAFKIRSDIREPISSVEELKPYVNSVHAAFDIADERYDIREGQTRMIFDFVANGSGARNYVIGEGVSPHEVDLDAITLTMHKDGQKIYEGNSTNIMGSPWNVLLSIANAHARRGNPLKAGDVIISGKVAPPYKASGADAIGIYMGDCDPLGIITIYVN